MKKVLLMLTLAMTFVVASCSSDDDGAAVEEITLQGDWQLTNVDFTVFKEEGRPASDACIIELVAGYQLDADGRAYVILGEGGFFDPYAEEYWKWEGDITNFEIIQINPARPPYNFGLRPTNIKSDWVDGVATMTFSSELGNGSVADFTLIKQAIDDTKLPVLTKPDGTVYHCGFFD